MNRIAELQKKLSGECFTIANPVDIYYLTGLKLSLGRLLISSDAYFIGIDGRYLAEAQAQFKERAILCEKGKWNALFKAFGKHQDPIYFDPNFESYASIESLKEIHPRLIPKANLITARHTKSLNEIAEMKKAALITEEGFQFVQEMLHVGMTEKKAACLLKAFWLEKRESECSFEPIIAFGEHTAYPHAKPSDRELQPNDVVLIDIGASSNSYQADMTRMVYFGEVAESIKKIVQQVRKAHILAVECAVPGASIAELDNVVRDFFRAAGTLDAFSHSLGHGIGLDVHEYPTIRSTATDVLREGMVITIEPGLYFPGLGGARLENTYLVGPHGLESFMESSLEPAFVPVSYT